MSNTATIMISSYFIRQKLVFFWHLHLTLALSSLYIFVKCLASLSCEDAIGYTVTHNPFWRKTTGPFLFLAKKSNRWDREWEWSHPQSNPIEWWIVWVVLTSYPLKWWSWPIRWGSSSTGKASWLIPYSPSVFYFCFNLPDHKKVWVFTFRNIKFGGQ